MKPLFHLCYCFFEYCDLFLKLILTVVSSLKQRCPRPWHERKISWVNWRTQTCERSICFSANLVKFVVKSSTRLSSKFLSSVFPSLVILSKKSEALLKNFIFSQICNWNFTWEFCVAWEIFFPVCFARSSSRFARSKLARARARLINESFAAFSRLSINYRQYYSNLLIF